MVGIPGTWELGSQAGSPLSHQEMPRPLKILFDSSAGEAGASQPIGRYGLSFVLFSAVAWPWLPCLGRQLAEAFLRMQDEKLGQPTAPCAPPAPRSHSAGRRGRIPQEEGLLRSRQLPRPHALIAGICRSLRKVRMGLPQGRGESVNQSRRAFPAVPRFDGFYFNPS